MTGRAAAPGAAQKAGWTLKVATGVGDERIVLTLAFCGVATSGDLERFAEVDGVSYFRSEWTEST